MTIVKNKQGRGRPRAFERATVLEQAMEVFWASGYEEASIPKLTEAMGISAQSLYAAFGSKEALYRESLEFYSSTIGRFVAHALDEEPDALNAIVRLLKDAAVLFSRTTGTPGCMIATPTVNSTEKTIATLGHTMRAESMAKIANRLERGIQEGQLRVDIDCATWSRYIGTVVQGMSIQARDGASTQELLSIAEIAVYSLSTLRR